MAVKAQVSIRPRRLPGVWSEFAKGALVGFVLWADKVFLFLQHPANFDSRLVFAALLPGVIIYNYFFVYVAPQVDGVASSVRDLLQVDDLTELRTMRDRYVGRLETAVAMCAVRGATLGAVSIVAAAAVAPRQAYQFAVLVAFTWCLVLVSICVYKLSYLGQVFVPYATCAACLLVLAVTFAFVNVGTGTYIVLATILALALLPLLHHLARQWRTPEYALFWQRATSW